MKSKGKISYTLILDKCKKISERISAGLCEEKNGWVKVFDELIYFFYTGEDEEELIKLILNGVAEKNKTCPIKNGIKTSKKSTKK